jgi:serine O-acetyltransferase
MHMPSYLSTHVNVACLYVGTLHKYFRSACHFKLIIFGSCYWTRINKAGKAELCNFMSLKENLLADLERHFFYTGQVGKMPTTIGIIKKALNLRFLPVLLCRLAHSSYKCGWKPLASMFSLLNFVVFGIEIGQQCEIGGGLYLPHTVGTVIGAWSIGRNAVIFQGVTLGTKVIDTGYNKDFRPSLGDNVTIGSGAKVLGCITIGANVIVGANAVVTKSLESNVVAMGVPAKVIRKIDAAGE